MKKRKLLIAFTFLFWILFINNKEVIAADQSQNAGSIMRQQLDIEKKRNIPTEIPKPPIIKEKNATLANNNIKILVKEFQFIGELKFISKSELNNHLKDLIGKTLSVDEIRNIQERLTKLYESKGFKFAKITIPKQEVQNGLITIKIEEGQSDTQNLKINSRYV